MKEAIKLIEKSSEDIKPPCLVFIYMLLCSIDPSNTAALFMQGTLIRSI